MPKTQQHMFRLAPDVSAKYKAVLGAQHLSLQQHLERYILETIEHDASIHVPSLTVASNPHAPQDDLEILLAVFLEEGIDLSGARS